MNLNGTFLLNCKWKHIKIHELNQLDGHNDNMNSVCFTPDSTVATCSRNPRYNTIDNSILLWDIKTR